MAEPAADTTSELAALRLENARLERELDECRRLVTEVMKAEDQGRRRIAQLLHDDALQALLAAHQELIEAAPGRAQVMRAHEVVEGTIARLREAMMALHPVTLEQGGFELALGAVARQAARAGEFEIEIDLDPELVTAHDELFLAVARELLTNAARHSEATMVRVTLRRAGDAVELEVADDGRGMEPGRRERALAEGHIGLASVAQRVHSEGGEFELESSPAGTTARARMPLDRP
ncbi:MAG TPA: ATP-binding protein [Solirubrobacterales bacterium]|nr:ATP-binding protein [Solirubrobacterales bacterium]